MKLPSTLRQSKFLLLGLFVFLSGCLEVETVSGYGRAPHVLVKSFTVSQDSCSGAEFCSTVTIVPPDAPAEGSPDERPLVESYVLRWGLDGVVAGDESNRYCDYQGVCGSNYIGSTPSTSTSFNIDTIPPVGVNSIIVLTSNPSGDAATYDYLEQRSYVYGLSRPFINAGLLENVPSMLTSNVIFSDTAPQIIKIGGTVKFSSSYSENNIDGYIVRYLGINGCPLSGAPLVAKKLTEIVGGPWEGYSLPITSRVPSAGAVAITVIPFNEFGEAFDADCNNYISSDPIFFNTFAPSSNPSYQPFVFASDVDETSTVKVNIRFNRIDERDLFGGYNVYISDGEHCFDKIANIPNGTGSVNIEKSIALGEASSYTSNGTTLYKDFVSVAAGSGCLAGSHHKISNAIGTWYTIRNKQTNLCMSAGATGNLDLVGPFGAYGNKCDEYDVKQRFYVRNIASPYDDGNNDYFTIQSVANGTFIHREETAESPWKLGSSASAWNYHLELKARTDLELKDKKYKKIAVVNRVADIYHFSCAEAHKFNNQKWLDGYWSNCSPIGEAPIEWIFTQPNGSIGLFNDP